jgi:hypothetical protein
MFAFSIATHTGLVIVLTRSLLRLLAFFLMLPPSL